MSRDTRDRRHRLHRVAHRARPARPGRGKRARAERLSHPTYNVASGRVTSNADVVEALRATAPDADLDLPSGAAPTGQPLDIARLREDTGFEPAYDTAAAAADYLAWLRAGHER